MEIAKAVAVHNCKKSQVCKGSNGEYGLPEVDGIIEWQDLLIGSHLTAIT